MSVNKYYYAVEWPLGYCMKQTKSGRPVEYAIPYRFASPDERRRWIEQGSSNMRERGYREPTRRRDISSAIDRAQQAADEKGHALWGNDGALALTFV